eukprot:m51a1_g9243 hypothetical protein (210) ;mRNA; r:132939-134225
MCVLVLMSLAILLVDTAGARSGVFYVDFNVLLDHVQYLEAYIAAHRLVKTFAEPGATVAGPSFSRWDRDMMMTWLEAMRHQETLPDVLTWNENNFTGATQLLAHIADAFEILGDRKYDAVHQIAISEGRLTSIGWLYQAYAQLGEHSGLPSNWDRVTVVVSVLSENGWSTISSKGFSSEPFHGTLIVQLDWAAGTDDLYDVSVRAVPRL